MGIDCINIALALKTLILKLFPRSRLRRLLMVDSLVPPRCMDIGVSSNRSRILVPWCRVLKPTCLRVVRPLTQHKPPLTLISTQAPKVLFIIWKVGVPWLLLIIRIAGVGVALAEGGVDVVDLVSLRAGIVGGVRVGILRLCRIIGVVRGLKVPTLAVPIGVRVAGVVSRLVVCRIGTRFRGVAWHGIFVRVAR